MRAFISLTIFVLIAQPALAGRKIDLDDMKIKGELHNDDHLRLLARDPNQLKNYVKFRTNYRHEIVQSISGDGSPVVDRAPASLSGKKDKKK